MNAHLLFVRDPTASIGRAENQTTLRFIEFFNVFGATLLFHSIEHSDHILSFQALAHFDSNTFSCVDLQPSGSPPQPAHQAPPASAPPQSAPQRNASSSWQNLLSGFAEDEHFNWYKIAGADQRQLPQNCRSITEKGWTEED